MVAACSVTRSRTSHQTRQDKGSAAIGGGDGEMGDGGDPGAFERSRASESLGGQKYEGCEDQRRGRSSTVKITWVSGDVQQLGQVIAARASGRGPLERQETDTDRDPSRHPRPRVVHSVIFLPPFTY